MLKILSLLIILNCYSLAWAQEKILVLGDSLTEGYGLDKESAYPAQLQKIFDTHKMNYQVVNGGVSGSTTASGLSRLNWFLKGNPKAVIIALGANDGLRGIKLKESKANLEKIILKAKSKNIKVFLAGMQLPPNYGKEYTSEFQKMFEELKKKHNVFYIPFLLKGVAGKKELNLEDGIHPNKKGHKIMAKTVYEEIKDLL
ncbi:MAG: arylesterase [Bacteriovoracaceae bacterium]|jgi:acyl-CoA thioesterase-1|nr:arylesterase [Bacteriovoracaceae bacterium]